VELHEIHKKAARPYRGLPVHTTKAMELRQKMQNQLKERLELHESKVGNIYGGDARGAKKVYVSKQSLDKTLQ
jgi:hypothetical protein